MAIERLHPKSASLLIIVSAIAKLLFHSLWGLLLAGGRTTRIEFMLPQIIAKVPELGGHCASAGRGTAATSAARSWLCLCFASNQISFCGTGDPV